MLNRVALAFLTAGLMTMSAATYKVSLHQDAVIDGKQVKAGNYKIEVKDNNTAVLTQGKKTVEVPVKTETAQSKFSSTQVQYTDGNNLQEIRVGGTNTKLVFGGDKPTTSNF
ncbi:MAG: hypothetical protein ACJ746_22340 [Bryobacteraceae bacterium]